jgi:hypothetical protein
MSGFQVCQESVIPFLLDPAWNSRTIGVRPPTGAGEPQKVEGRRRIFGTQEATWQCVPQVSLWHSIHPSWMLLRSLILVLPTGLDQKTKPIPPKLHTNKQNRQNQNQTKKKPLGKTYYPSQKARNCGLTIENLDGNATLIQLSTCGKTSPAYTCAFTGLSQKLGLSPSLHRSRQCSDPSFRRCQVERNGIFHFPQRNRALLQFPCQDSAG